MGIIAILSLRKKSFRSPAIITYGTLQIHGIASIVEYGTTEYNIGRENYDERFPQYMELFEKADNELYIIKPLIIWNYNPSLGGEMYREMLVFDENYLNQIEAYYPHTYKKR